MLTRTAFVALAALLGLAALPAAAQNPTQIAAVKGGAKACAGCNLFQADFGYMNLIGRDFAKARLRQADFTAAEADRARFAGADLSILNAFAARFSGADFAGANLAQGSFVGAYFGGANLSGADLTGANFGGADLSAARGLTQAQLNTACGDAATLLPPGLTVPGCES